MTDPAFDERTAASRVLDDLESLEMPLLSWGITTGTLSEEEVRGVVDTHLDSWPLGTLAEDIIELLVDRALLFPIPGSSPRKYRTRLAETVRLAATLRQLFPVDSPSQGWWRHRPTLVADYRLHVAPRRYPSRDVPTSSAIEELSKTKGWLDELTPVVEAAIRHSMLARFQVDAAKSILVYLAERESRGVIVGAGTGSGKTMAFYVPAFTAMASHAIRGGVGVHTIALYPRNELLRDQLREAMSRLPAINEALVANGRRALRVGVLYGDTPYDSGASFYFGPKSPWKPHKDAFVCPYMKCPDCRGDLVWTDADRKLGIERLTCTNPQRPYVIEHLALTRRGLKSDPPDLLFTTTEMLNRNATDPDMGRLLGWTSGASSPSLVLLDEAHTYAGVHGAQVALLLRRWRYALKGKPVFVGLSATLRDAADFFAQLTGLARSAVELVEPAPSHLLEEGREYAIALRNDPLSQASALSTTIQAAMLFGRVLDLPGREWLFGSRGFLFTDDLDVTNRLFHDLSEAEGKRGRKRVLAGLRSSDAPYRPERFPDGQSWDLVQEIGRPLDPATRAGGLYISLTSSQSSGVAQDSDLVVATASLEVGFDDDRVGLVLQHKAPRDPASFVQRRGRAGRSRGTRPWTVVTLTDYGRDRFTYQSYDTLFAPELPARRLPVTNRFVLKIQAAQALLVWASLRTGLNARAIVEAPRELSQQPAEADQKAIVSLLSSLVTDEALLADLRSYLCSCLQITADEANALLWDSPRSLLLAVAPTIVRRLDRRWRAHASDPGARPRSLMPEFVTQTLFDSLNVPEVTFNVEFLDDDPVRRIEVALREAVPGKVSLRYGYSRADQRTWVPIPAVEGSQLDVSEFLDEYIEEGEWSVHGGTPIQVLRPLAIRLQQPPEEIADQSQGIPRWNSQFLDEESLTETDVPRSTPWRHRVTSMAFGTGAIGNPIVVRRFTDGADCTVKHKYGTAPERELAVGYCRDKVPVALGFSLTVDGVRFQIAPLDLTSSAVTEYLRSPQWRGFAFNAALQDDPALAGHANGFQRRWLTLVYTTAFALKRLENPSVTSEEVHRALSGGSWTNYIERVLNAIYRDDIADSPARLIATLRALADDAVVVESVDRNARILWSDEVASISADLAQKTYLETIAAAIRVAVQRACPEAQDNDLIVDVLPPVASKHATIWLTETSLGGLGIIAKFVDYYAADPVRFWHLVDGALEDGEHEYVRDTIKRLLAQTLDQPESLAARAVSRLRAPESSADAASALKDLRHAWAQVDAPPRHAAVAALSSRYLRPGTSESTDRIVIGLHEAWQKLEQLLGFEVDGGIFAYLSSTGVVDVPGLAGRQLNPDQIFSLLIPGGSEARSEPLRHYQPYCPNLRLDPLLARAAHVERLSDIDVTDSDWAQAYVREMTEHARVRLSAPVNSLKQFTRALREVPAISVDRDVLRLHGTVTKLSRSAGRVSAIVELTEAAG